ncbi:DMT family transporter, partial [bacterium]|nr:DMT family transporter [bacterium]
MLIANHQLRGIILILTAAVLWGTTGTAQTFAPLTLSSYWVGAIRLLVAGGFFVLWLGVRDIRQFSVARLQALPWSMILIAALGITTYNLAFFAGVRSTSVAIGTAIALGSGPVWAGILQSTIY